MPAIDFPLPKLLTYAGSSPKPADFDAYWAKALAELDALDPQPELVEADYPVNFATCYDLYFTGVGGARLHARVVKPKNQAKPGPGLVSFHGYSGNCGSWLDYFAYAAAGFTVTALDCRGQGGQSEDTVPTVGNTLHGHIIKGIDDVPEKLYYRNVYLDTVLLARLTMEMDSVDAERVVCTGGSQGGALSLACASLEPRIKKCYSQFPFLSDFKRVWEMGLDKAAYTGLRDYFRRFDPFHQREEEIFTKLGYIDVTNLSPRIQGEVLMYLSLSDEICPPSTQFAAYNAITSKKSNMIAPDFGHETPPRQCPETVYQFLTDI